MELRQVTAQGAELVNELSVAVDRGRMGLKEVEELILQFVNRIGDLMEQEVVEKLSEPPIQQFLGHGERVRLEVAR